MSNYPASSPRCESRDVFLLLLILVGGLTYLGLPLANAVLQSLMVAAQGFLGTVILRRFLDAKETSVLLVIGPGWIVGSAASFVVFQLLGRNTFAVIAVWSAGLAAFFVIHGSRQTHTLSIRHIWTMSQLVGLATLSMSWEFPELVPTAIGALAFGLLSDIRNRLPIWVFRGGSLAIAVVALAPIMLRQDYWWLVTDDYSFFQLLSQHLTQSGPFARWGLVSFAEYHWLSYGISGMLDSLGGPLAPQLTLSLTIPYVYSLSLSSSLILLSQRISPRALTTTSLTPAWVIVAVTVLDWSGTSTAGVYAANAAMAVVALALIEKRPPVIDRLLVYLGFAVIVAFTKLGSIFVILLIFALVETNLLRKLHNQRLRLTVSLMTVTAATSGLLPLLWLVGELSDGFSIKPINPALGWPLETGVSYVLFGLAVNRLWLIVPLLSIAVYAWRKSRKEFAPLQVELLIALIPIGVFGLLLDLVISGNSEGFSYGGSSRFQYFSGPMYFVASLGLVGLLHFLPVNSLQLSSRFVTGSLFAALLGAGLAWDRWVLGERLWVLISQRLVPLDESVRVWLGFMSRDARIGSSLLALLALPLAVVFWKIGSVDWTLLLLKSLVGVSACLGLGSSLVSFERVRLREEIVWAEGVSGARDAGWWLKENSESSDLVATNHLINPDTGALLTDFSLGSWSEREFYVLGPSFLPVFGEIEKALEVSLRFGIEPSVEDLSTLIGDGVSWFIIDRTISSYPYWFDNWDVVYINERFLILKLTKNSDS